ncbi:MAG: hypothetical protein WCV88_05570 [Patescibacteria group bacterium]|jgi:hypothetical protein
MNKKTLLSALSVGAASLLLIGVGCTSNTATTTTTPPKTTTTNTPSTTTTTTNTSKTNTSKTNTNTTVTVTTSDNTFDETATDAAIQQDVNGQWAATATASTEYGTDSWAAKQATSLPNVESYGDNGNSWAHLERNKGLETLSLTYSKAAYATGVRIHETYGSGAVTKVELKDIDGVYHSVWAGTDTTTSIGYLQIPVDKTSYQVNGVRITVDTTLVPDEWVEIDAVQLVGEL